MSEDSQLGYWKVTRVWYVRANTAMEAIEAARPGEHRRTLVEAAETTTIPTDLTELP